MRPPLRFELGVKTADSQEAVFDMVYDSSLTEEVVKARIAFAAEYVHAEVNEGSSTPKILRSWFADFPYGTDQIVESKYKAMWNRAVADQFHAVPIS